ncbi:MAG: hypothetical protein IKR35_06340, partial [Lachnospiraceae bacterium]|nr:hypothetical protein [Lachnospiraceae bacterium]
MKSIEEDQLVVKFYFEIKGLEKFVSKWKFPLKLTLNDGAEDVKILKRKSREELLDDEILDRMIFSLGMVETISYYKITCPKTVVIDCGNLTKEQQKWWQKLYRNGLGEFLYINGI